MRLTQKEKNALMAILNVCQEQFSSSGGDIDYAGFGEESQIIINSVIKKLENDGQIITGDICTTYAPDSDMTFIMQEVRFESGKYISTECVGWYYGRPDERLTAEYAGKLQAEYT